MTDDITDDELVERMTRWAEFEDKDERLAPFREACTAIVLALGKSAPEMLAGLPAAVVDVVVERNELRQALRALRQFNELAVPLPHGAMAIIELTLDGVGGTGAGPDETDAASSSQRSPGPGDVPLTGAERYLDDRLKNPEYLQAYLRESLVQVAEVADVPTFAVTTGEPLRDGRLVDDIRHRIKALRLTGERLAAANAKLKAEAGDLRTEFRKQALQALSDEGQYEENYQARLKADAEVGRLRTLAYMLYRSLYDGPIDELSWLVPEGKELLAQVVEQVKAGTHTSLDNETPPADAG